MLSRLNFRLKHLALILIVGGCGEAEPALRVHVQPCPDRMIQVGTSCIDRYEARLVEGEHGVRAEPADHQLPATEVDYRTADRACRASGFRLCSGEEWTRACAGAAAGAAQRALPYGAIWEPHRCNTIEATDDLDSFSLGPGGSFERCVTSDGVYDLSGNVWEWTSEVNEAGSSYELRGGGAHNGESQSKCLINDRFFQPPESHEGFLGFRCCQPVARR